MFLVTTLSFFFFNILSYLNFFVLLKTVMNTAFFFSQRFLHVNSGYPLFSHVQTQNFYYAEKIVCGAGHTFAAGIQNNERNKKLGIGCISIYLYANYQFSSQKYIFHLHWGLEEI